MNAKAPIHITTGSAGNYEGKGYISKTHPPYIAQYSNDYGYLMISVLNLTHLQFDYISTEKVRFSYFIAHAVFFIDTLVISAVTECVPSFLGRTVDWHCNGREKCEYCLMKRIMMLGATRINQQSQWSEIVQINEQKIKSWIVQFVATKGVRKITEMFALQCKSVDDTKPDNIGIPTELRFCPSMYNAHIFGHLHSTWMKMKRK